MAADIDAQAFLDKAAESLASARADFAAGRYNSCANRAYYACYQSAVAALIAAGLMSSDTDGRNQHGPVQALFIGHLINRRKLYSADLRTVLRDLMELRIVADYKPAVVSRSQVARGLRQAGRFVDAVTSVQGAKQ
jgi:uncharacterized protein (UPF0332 family)